MLDHIYLSSDYIMSLLKLSTTNNVLNSPWDKNLKRVNEVTKWHPPDSSFVEISLYGSVAGNNLAIGFVIHDDNCCPIIACAGALVSCTVTVAEALAFRDALKFSF